MKSHIRPQTSSARAERAKSMSATYRSQWGVAAAASSPPGRAGAPSC